MGKSKKRKKAAETTPSFGFPFAPSYLQDGGGNLGEAVSGGESESAFSIYGRNRGESDDDTCSVSSIIFAPDRGTSPIADVELNEVRAGHMHLLAKSNGKLLISFQNEATLHLAGSAALTALLGTITVNGYQVPLRRKTNIFSPAWMPATAVQYRCGSCTTVKNVMASYPLEEYAALFAEVSDTSSTHTCIAIIESGPSDSWMYAAEDTSKYLHTDFCFGSGIIAEQMTMSALHIDAMFLPSSWSAAADQLLDTPVPHPHILIAGAKGTGKSTCMRYTINRLLSKHKTVAVIDCDVGQSEFTPSGQISLHFITSPVLAPSHVNMKNPHLSFFIGDNVLKHDAHLLEDYLRQLYDTYVSLRNIYQSHHSFTPKKTANAYDALDDSHFPLPLIINTDGWIRNFGTEILISIIRRVTPTHVLQMYTEKDKIIDAFSYLPQQCHLLHVTPGRTTASRLTAMELRNLRLISYFLGESSYLKDRSSQLYIRSGAVGDPRGHIFAALHYEPQCTLHFQNIVFSVIGTSVVPRLMLAAFNMCLVALSIEMPQYIHSTTLALREKQFAISVNPLPMQSACSCIGYGIVTEINIAEQSVSLLVPNAIREKISCLVTSGGRLHLIRGQLNLSSSMIFAPELNSCPYMTAESMGEGSSILRKRSNVKRRGQEKKN